MALIDYTAWAIYIAGIATGLKLFANCFSSPIKAKFIWWVGLAFLLCPWFVEEGSSQLAPGVFLGVFDFLIVERSLDNLLWGLRAPAAAATLAIIYCLSMRQRWQQKLRRRTGPRRRQH